MFRPPVAGRPLPTQVTTEQQVVDQATQSMAKQNPRAGAIRRRLAQNKKSGTNGKSGY